MRPRTASRTNSFLWLGRGMFTVRSRADTSRATCSMAASFSFSEPYWRPCFSESSSMTPRRRSPRGRVRPGNQPRQLGFRAPLPHPPETPPGNKHRQAGHGDEKQEPADGGRRLPQSVGKVQERVGKNDGNACKAYGFQHLHRSEAAPESSELPDQLGREFDGSGRGHAYSRIYAMDIVFASLPRVMKQIRICRRTGGFFSLDFTL